MITTRSESLFEQAGKHLVGGVGSGTRSPRSGWLPAPVFVRSGEGAWLTDEDDNSSMSTLGTEDQQLEQLEGWADVAPLLRTLPERERLLLYYRFVAGMPQSVIAQKLGISQMHVSRLLARTLATLRNAVNGAS